MGQWDAGTGKFEWKNHRVWIENIDINKIANMNLYELWSDTHITAIQIILLICS